MKKLLTAMLSLAIVGCSAAPSGSVVDYDQALDLIENEQALIIDVRTPEEYAERHVAGALNIPLSVIEDEISNHVATKDQAMVLYCRSGNRSNQARVALEDIGYTKVYDLGAIGNWKGEFE